MPRDGGLMVADGPIAGGDDALMARVAAGDGEAFRILVDRHLDRVVRLVERLSGSRSTAEDVAQETFLRLWQRADAWRPGGAQLSTWLYRVAFNLGIDAKRRTSRVRSMPDEDLPELPDPGPDAYQALAERRRGAAVDAAVRDLPDRQREAILLTYAAGLSNAEVAATLGVTVEAVEALLTRARRTLRRTLADAASERG